MHDGTLSGPRDEGVIRVKKKVKHDEHDELMLRFIYLF